MFFLVLLLLLLLLRRDLSLFRHDHLSTFMFDASTGQIEDNRAHSTGGEDAACGDDDYEGGVGGDGL